MCHHLTPAERERLGLDEEWADESDGEPESSETESDPDPEPVPTPSD